MLRELAFSFENVIFTDEKRLLFCIRFKRVRGHRFAIDLRSGLRATS